MYFPINLGQYIKKIPNLQERKEKYHQTKKGKTPYKTIPDYPIKIKFICTFN